MIQLNLLPDVKLEYLKAERSRRLAISIAMLAALVSIGLLTLLLIFDGLQHKHLQDLSNNISRETNQLQQQPNIGKVLTVQNQLQSLTALHSTKPATSRLFGYLNQITPVEVSIASFNVDFNQQTATITGSADSLASVNKYVDTLKFTTYNAGSANSKAFSNVVLSSFGLGDSSQNGQSANYTINLSYDKTLFDITQEVKLAVPSKVTTRSAIDQSGDLFQSGGSH